MEAARVQDHETEVAELTAMAAGGAVAVTVAGQAVPAAAIAGDPLVTGVEGMTAGANTSTLQTGDLPVSA